MEHMPAMKWFLKVWMARSAALRRWMCGGASWKSTSSSVMNDWRAAEASLSKRWRAGLSPRDMRSAWTRAYAARMAVPDLDGIGSTWI